MTKVWNEDGFVKNDPWVIDIDAESNDQHIILPLQDAITKLSDTNDVEVGVLINPADDITKLEPYLTRIALVAITFPAFNDGRGFSQATTLRGKLKYNGEVRAVGDVLLDQIPLMQRTGFDSFQVSNETAINRLGEKRLPTIFEAYQPTVTSIAADQSYSWRRRLPNT